MSHTPYPRGNVAASAQACDSQAADTSQTGAQGADTDNVAQQCGDQQDGGAETTDGQQSQAGTLDDGKDLLPRAGITIEQAIAAARTAATGDIGEIDLEQAGGVLMFNVDVGNRDVKVDAATGAIVASDQDD